MGPSTDGSAAGGQGGDCLARFRIWPHRSLGRAGAVALLGAVAAGTLLPILMVPHPAAALPLASGALVASAGLALALWKNNQAGRIAETIVVRPDRISVTRENPTGPSRTMEFATGWVRIDVSHDRLVEHRVTLRESGRGCSVGEFLSPDERRDLATALNQTLAQARQSCRGAD